jgi:hypothetical protein
MSKALLLVYWLVDAFVAVGFSWTLGRTALDIAISSAILFGFSQVAKKSISRGFFQAQLKDVTLSLTFGFLAKIFTLVVLDYLAFRVFITGSPDGFGLKGYILIQVVEWTTISLFLLKYNRLK